MRIAGTVSIVNHNVCLTDRCGVFLRVCMYSFLFRLDDVLELEVISRIYAILIVRAQAK